MNEHFKPPMSAQPFATLTDLIDEHPYSAQQIADFYNVSKSFVKTQIRKQKLAAFWFGRNYRIRGREAKKWVEHWETTNSASSGTDGVSPGMKKAQPVLNAVRDSAFRAALRTRAPKR